MTTKANWQSCHCKGPRYVCTRKCQRPTSDDVRYYVITGWGRTRLDATTDAEAIQRVEERMHKYPTIQHRKIIKETVEELNWHRN